MDEAVSLVVLYLVGVFVCVGFGAKLADLTVQAIAKRLRIRNARMRRYCNQLEGS